MNGSQEGLVLLDHRSLIHNDALKFAFTKLLRTGFANCSHDYWADVQDLLLELLLVSEEFEELIFAQLLDRFNIEAEEAHIIAVQLLLLFANIEGYFFLITPIDFFDSHIDV